MVDVLYQFCSPGGAQLLVREAGLDDLDNVVAIEQQTYSTPWSRSSFASELTQERSLFWVIEMEGKVCGYQIGWRVLDAYHLHNIALARQARGQGIGREILTFLVSYLRRFALQSLELEVRASNLAGLALYRGFGFQPVGIRPRYYRHPVEDAVLMQFLV